MAENLALDISDALAGRISNVAADLFHTSGFCERRIPCLYA